MPRQDAFLWTLDTCGCQHYVRSDGTVLEYGKVLADWTARITALDPTANPMKPLPPYRCPAHSAISTVDAAFASCKGENKAKNAIHGQIGVLLSKDLEDVEFGWSFDASRVMKVSGEVTVKDKVSKAETKVKLSSKQKGDLQSWADTNISAGKVVVE